jgi:outer membrane lipoprotein-sorting protein
MTYTKYTIGLVFVAFWLGVGSSSAAEKESSSPSSPSPLNALSADFVMTRTISAMKSELESKGRLMLGGKGLLRWETLSPSKSTLVIRRDIAWISYPDLNVTKQFDIAADPVMRIMSEHLLLLTSGRFDDLGTLYDVFVEKDGRRRLLPKSAEIKKIFREMRVTADAVGAVKEVVLVSANGDTTKISFYNIVLNPSFSEDLFLAPKQR